MNRKFVIDYLTYYIAMYSIIFYIFVNTTNEWYTLHWYIFIVDKFYFKPIEALYTFLAHKSFDNTLKYEATGLWEVTRYFRL